MVNSLVKKSVGKSSRTSPAPPKPRKPDEVSMRKAGADTFDPHEARYALETLTRAEEIRRDKRLMAAVHKHAKEHMESVDAALGGGLKRGRGK